jgi:hypothetical protein
MPSAIATPSRRQTSTQPSSTQTQGLPDYVAPQAILNAQGQDALVRLLRTYPLAAIDEKLRAACTLLIECAGDINERITDINSLHKKKKDKQAEKGDENDEPPVSKEEDDKIKTLDEKVSGMTSRMERELRKGIDANAHINALENAIKDLRRTSEVAATQATQAPSSNVTLPGSTAPNVPPLTPVLQGALDRHMDRYTNISLAKRYSENNEYVSFKQTVHEAKYPAEQKGSIPLPHARTWFAGEDGGAPPEPGTTGAGGGDDDDDDIAIDRENISTRCPITLAEFDKPVRSAKCNHSFESKAIEEMIAQSRPPTGHGRRDAAWVKNVQCPVSGCSCQITAADLVHDVALVRRIKRLQKAAARAEEEGDTTNGGRSGRQVEEIVSDVDDVDGDVQRAPRSSGVPIKRRHDEIEDD